MDEPTDDEIDAVIEEIKATLRERRIKISYYTYDELVNAAYDLISIRRQLTELVKEEIAK